MFQPTHPHGVRPVGRILLRIDHFVSTHAPARGATIAEPHMYPTILGFNPRTRTGCDGRTAFSFLSLSSFNPRTRTGCDAVWQC